MKKILSKRNIALVPLFAMVLMLFVPYGAVFASDADYRLNVLDKEGYTIVDDAGSILVDNDLSVDFPVTYTSGIEIIFDEPIDLSGFIYNSVLQKNDAFRIKFTYSDGSNYTKMYFAGPSYVDVQQDISSFGTDVKSIKITSANDQDVYLSEIEFMKSGGYPPSSSDYQGGLTDLATVSGGAVDSANLNDDDLLTSAFLDKKTNDVLYSFSRPVDVEQVIASFDVDDGDSVLVNFFSSDNVQLGYATIENSNQLKNVSYTGVSQIKVRSDNDYSDLEVFEFEAFGQEPEPDIDPPSEVGSLLYTPSTDKAIFSWTNPTDGDFKEVNVYKDDTLVKTTTGTAFETGSLIYDQDYVYRFETVDTSGNKSTGVERTVNLTEPIDDQPTADITGLSTTPYSDHIQLQFVPPSDPDYAGTKIYLDDVLKVTLDENTAAFDLTGLEEETTYTLRLVALDQSGNESPGVTSQVETTTYVDTTPPAVPENVQVTNGSSSLLVNWSKNTDSDLHGYNVYINGLKQNSGVITSSSFSVAGLTNDESYTVSVSAVDHSGNESALTDALNGTPTTDALPILTVGFDLGDVADGVTTWFDSLWLILAFAVAIPLAFYIGNRVKQLVLS